METKSRDSEVETSPVLLPKSASMVDISHEAKKVVNPRTSSLPVTATEKYRNKPAMSVRTLQESLKGNSTYRDAARSRRSLRRLSSLSAQSGQTSKNDEDLSVSFSSVEIREYAIRMGDNPSVSAGPPITIEWKHFNEKIIDIDTFEKNLPPRRPATAMAIPAKERYVLLSGSTSLSRNQLTEQLKKVMSARLNRNKTLAMLEFPQYVFVEEKLELAKRGLRNRLQKDRKRQEKEMIMAALEQDRKEREMRLSLSY